MRVAGTVVQQTNPPLHVLLGSVPPAALCRAKPLPQLQDDATVGTACIGHYYSGISNDNSTSLPRVKITSLTNHPKARVIHTT
jgi:hypothetical protein